MDRDSKGRGAKMFGESNGAARLRGEARSMAKAAWLDKSITAEEAAKIAGLTVRGMYRSFGPRGRRVGTMNHRAKLSEKNIAEIRRLLDAGNSVASVARLFNVAWPQIKRIKTGEGWRNA